jgi:hypothetical protein
VVIASCHVRKRLAQEIFTLDTLGDVLTLPNQDLAIAVNIAAQNAIRAIHDLFRGRGAKNIVDMSPKRFVQTFTF